MKTFFSSLVIVLFIIPAAVAAGLLIAFLGELSESLYFFVICLAAGFATATAVWGTFWFMPSTEECSDLSSGHHHGSSFQEKNHEKRQESEVRS